MKGIVCVIMATLTISVPMLAEAQQRCPADDMSCTKQNWDEKVQDRIKKGKNEVFEASGPRDKAKAVGNTIRDCTDCATKVLRDEIDGNVDDK